MNKVIPYWNDTITILNKLSGKDSATKLDTWKATVISGCFFKQTVTRSISGTTVNVGSSSVCRIPKSAGSENLYHIFSDSDIQDVEDSKGALFSTSDKNTDSIPRYYPYNIWKKDITIGFTLNPGDYIFKGEIEEDVTANNVISLYNSYKPNAMLVRAVSDNSDFLGLAEHYRVEGI